MASLDLRYMVIPNWLVYPLLALALLVSGAWPNRGVVEALAGGMAALAAAAAIWALSRGSMGGGDVKMAVLVGVVVGGPGLVVAGLVTAVAGASLPRCSWSRGAPSGAAGSPTGRSWHSALPRRCCAEASATLGGRERGSVRADGTRLLLAVGMLAAAVSHRAIIATVVGAFLVTWRALPVHLVCVWFAGNVARNKGRDPDIGHALGVWFSILGPWRSV